jgi:hypothetical protein
MKQIIAPTVILISAQRANKKFRSVDPWLSHAGYFLGFFTRQYSSPYYAACNFRDIQGSLHAYWYGPYSVDPTDTIVACLNGDIFINGLTRGEFYNYVVRPMLVSKDSNPP